MPLQTYIRWRERRFFAIDAAHKRVEPLDWGFSHLDLPTPAADPFPAMMAYVRRHIRESDAFFSCLPADDYRLAEGTLSFASAVATETPENNTVTARLLETGRRDFAVVLFPHWNAQGPSYDALAAILRFCGIPCLRLTLPYHDQRRQAGVATASQMVSANIGRTIRSSRQGVLDARRAIHWLRDRGYRRIGLVGTSIGSSIASLTAAHEPAVTAIVMNLMSSNFGRVVWTGMATEHIRQGLEGQLTEDHLADLWSIISPITYVSRFRGRAVRQLIVSGKYDPVFAPHLTRALLDELRRHDIDHTWREYYCGHATLGMFPMSWLNLVQIVRFLRSCL